jgi:hypothetical protein
LQGVSAGIGFLQFDDNRPVHLGLKSLQKFALKQINKLFFNLCISLENICFEAK